VFSQLMLALPLVVLYEAGILAARFFVPKPSAEAEAENGAAS
jgi:sec-independent protein translocase protein TatC